MIRGTLFLGASAEIIAQVSEKMPPSVFKSKPVRVALPDTPVPACSEATYYHDSEAVVKVAAAMMGITMKGAIA